MSLKRNILANYASQFYVIIIGIVMVPLYIKYMGSEAYGLVGLFTMLQAWFSLLDMGLTPTISRETARFNGGVTDVLSYRRLVRALEGIFLLVAVMGGGALYAGAAYIAKDWLKVQEIPLAEVQLSLEYMAIAVALRWMSGLYRGAISGYERMVWLSGFNTVIASLRFVGVLPVLIYFSHKPTTFFAYQLGVSVLEIAGLLFFSYRLFPSVPKGENIQWAFAPLKPILKFSLTIAFTSSVWILVTQTDKLILSKILSLVEYGHFTLAVLVAGGIMIISGPISSAIMPRMANLEARGDHLGLIKLYRESTQLVSVLAGSAAVTLAFCAELLLWVWTGDRLLAKETAPILQIYAVGNGILAVAAFPYYLQYAKGDLRLHFLGNMVFVIIFVPAIIYVSQLYGGIGAGYVWLIMNLISLAAWIPFVHNKFAPKINFNWYTKDISLIVAPQILVGYFLSSRGSEVDDQYYLKILTIFYMALLTTTVGALFSSSIRSRLVIKFRS
jgi:O-antigen/teichoic acid export membrane protein